MAGTILAQKLPRQCLSHSLSLHWGHAVTVLLGDMPKLRAALLCSTWREAHAVPCYSPMGCAGAWLLLKVNGLQEREAPGTSGSGTWRAPGESMFCLAPTEHHSGRVCRQLWMHGWSLPGCLWSAWFPVLPTEIPSNSGRAEGGVAKQHCFLLSTPLQKDLEVWGA